MLNKKIDGSESSTAKGVNIATEFNKKIIKHKIGTYEIHKISLSCFDNKRQVLGDGIHTSAYCHRDSRNSFPDIPKIANFS